MYFFNLFFQYKEYEMIVVEDRIEKEKARRKLDLEAIELKAAIRVSFLSTVKKTNTLNP